MSAMINTKFWVMAASGKEVREGDVREENVT